MKRVAFVLFMSMCISASADTVPEWKVREAEKLIIEKNKLLREQGHNWKAGITCFTFQSDEEKSKFIKSFMTNEQYVEEHLTSDLPMAIIKPLPV